MFMLNTVNNVTLRVVVLYYFSVGPQELFGGFCFVFS